MHVFLRGVSCLPLIIIIFYYVIQSLYFEYSFRFYRAIISIAKFIFLNIFHYNTLLELPLGETSRDDNKSNNGLIVSSHLFFECVIFLFNIQT